MKKVLALGLLAFGCLAVSQQQASAWVNSRFGVGLNWDYQSGGNSGFWGLYRNSQPPGYEQQGHGHGFGKRHHQGYPAPMYGSGTMYAPAQYTPAPTPIQQPTPMVVPPQSAPEAQPPQTPNSPSVFNTPLYQFANYPQSSYYAQPMYYPDPMYYAQPLYYYYPNPYYR